MRAADHRRMPWRNGGGVTREIARSPSSGADSDFDWRVSIAEVATGGPFSRFPGIDRVLIRIGEAPLALVIAGRERSLERFEQCIFDGEAETSANLPGGPTSDLNVMTRRGRVSAEVRVLQLGGEFHTIDADQAQMMVVALDGSAAVHVGGAEIALEPRDALVFERHTATLRGDGTAVAIRLAAVE